ncbi:HAD-IIA family hydrolase [Williamsia sterculiae]|uniref:HAD-IIA family hydrolase n=1 Tax=Williamsia sterculiae TaxID=1344003 RepID=UPI001F27EEF1|nr:HAD-IIA family hydrolase [Williamsia sterculiae]
MTPQDLDGEIRRDLLTLDRTTADEVARHLVMVSRLLIDDPERALLHARAARQRAARVAVVRETAGVAAYNAQEWSEALTELRAARRMSGTSALLPLMADAERGLGRPEKAIDLARGAEGRALTGDEATEMRLVEAGARIDLGEPEKAVVTLQGEDLDPSRTGTAPARLFYAYASALLAAGRVDDAVTWFMNAAAADLDDVTDAEERLTELADPATRDDRTPSPSRVESAAAVPDTDATTAGGGETSTSVEVPDTEVAADQTPDAAQDPTTADESVPSDDVSRDAVVRTPVDHTDLSVTDPTGDDASAEKSLAANYDVLLLDLDGTLYAGQRAIPGATEALSEVDNPSYYVTNNASRRPDEVAAHLEELGFSATAEQVVTSAQTGARLLADHLQPGQRALVVGTDGLAQEVREVAIGVTRSADDRPAAVIQGHSPDTGWQQLSEAALAINAGALWIACNVDATLPTERGFAVGNGSMVAAVANATGKQPIVAGKPAAPLMDDAIARSGARNPLVVGDRLDTDIAGANTVGLDSLMVLTGVSSVADLLAARPEHRPTHVGPDLTTLSLPADRSRIAPAPGWTIEVSGDVITVRGDDDADPSRVLPALVAAAWEAGREKAPQIRADGERARAALGDLGL